MRSPDMKSVFLECTGACGSYFVTRDELLYTSVQVPFFSSSCPHPHYLPHTAWHVLFRLQVPLRASFKQPSCFPLLGVLTEAV